uniref:Uncharacterized protein n=1 Tax=Peronospora matthiolae TaxID=2874970 RepID=A0AAV1URH5_9STRA
MPASSTIGGGFRPPRRLLAQSTSNFKWRPENKDDGVVEFYMQNRGRNYRHIVRSSETHVEVPAGDQNRAIRSVNQGAEDQRRRRQRTDSIGRRLFTAIGRYKAHVNLSAQDVDRPDQSSYLATNRDIN